MVSYNQILDVQLADVVTEPVTGEEAKLFCKIDISDDNDLIEELITAAREMCEKYTGISFVKREVTAVFNNSNGGTYLPYGPVGEITEILDEDGDEILAANYKIIGSQFKQLKEPCYAEITATYEGGYDTLPKELKTALLEAIFYMYDNRSVGDDIGEVAIKKLRRYRRV